MHLRETITMCCTLPVTARSTELLEGFPSPVAFVLDPSDDLQTNILQPHDRHALTMC